jgi:hypothetical protein
MFSLARQRLGSMAAFVLVGATAFTLQWLAGWTLYGLLIFMACATAVLRHGDRPTGLGFAVALGAAVGLGGLGKLNIAAVSLVIATFAVLTTARSRRDSVLSFAASVVAAFGLSWIISGQRIESLGGYLRGAWEISIGYGQSMGQLDPQAGWGIGVAALGTAILAGLIWLRSSDLVRRDRLGLWVLFGIVLFAAFKGGFTRQGVGMVIYVVTLLALWPVVIPRGMPAVGVAMPVAGMLGMVLALSALPVTALLDPVSRLRAVASQAEVVLFVRDEAAAATRSALQALHGLPPEAVALLDGHAVHIEPWQTAIAYAEPGMTWRPQPVFHAYSAYTPYLDRQNAELLASAEAPDRILWLTDPDVGLSIDGRSMWFDSPEAKVEMVCRYLPIATGATWQVLGRVADRCGSPVAAGTTTGNAGQPVAIPDGLPPGILTVRVSGMGQDPISQLVTLAYRAPAWWWDQGSAVFRVPLGVNGQPIVVAATTDVGYDGALALPAVPATLTIGPDAGVRGDGSPLVFVFEVIPIVVTP